MERFKKMWYPWTMLIVLLIQLISSPLAAFAEVTSSREGNVTLDQLHVSDNEEDENSVLLTIDATVSNTTEENQTTTFTFSQEAALIEGEQPAGVQVSQNEARSIQIEYAPQSHSSVQVKVKVAKTEQAQTFIVTKGSQTLETTIPILAEEPAVEDGNNEVSEETANNQKDADVSEKKDEAVDDTSKKTETEEKQNDTSTVEQQEEKEESASSKENENQDVTSEKRDPINIASLFDDEDTFITNLSVNVYDATSGTAYDYKTETIPADALIQLSYAWAIPEHLLEPLVLQAGDYYEIDIPDSLVVKPGKGDLINPDTKEVYGEYEFTDSGKIRWTFNSKIEEQHDIKGTTNYMETLTDDTDLGSTTIKVPVGDHDELVELTTKPTSGQSISKKGTLDGDKSIDWTVMINTELATLTDAYVKEEMPINTEVKSIQVFKQTINKGGDYQVESNPLVEGQDYTWDQTTNQISFIGDYKNTNDSFVIKYHTDILDDSIPFEGGKQTYKNTATLVNGTKETPASSSVEKNFGKLIEKSNPKLLENGSGQVYSWQIKYNYGLKELPENTQIIDTLQNDDLTYNEDSFVIKSKDTVLEKGKDYTLDFSGKSVTISFPNGLNQAVTIDYKTTYHRVIDDNLPDGEKIANDVSTTVNGKTIHDSGEKTIVKNGITKSHVIDYNERTITWTVVVNRFNYMMENWSMSDTIPEGLTYKSDTFSIKTGNTVLTKDSDYTVTWSENGFQAAFLGKLKEGTDKTYTITYTTTFDLRRGSYTNQATSTWDSGDTTHTQSTKDTAEVSKNFVSDASKSGKYDATTKKISWSTIVNYNQDTLNKATIVDPIIGDQSYVDKTAKLYEVTINKDGTTVRGAESSVTPTYDEKNKTVSVDLPNGNKSYELYFETSLEGHYIIDEYHNSAVFTNGEYSFTADASVSPKNGGELATKKGQVDPTNSNYVLWEVTVNPSLSTLKELVVVDKPSTNQSLDEQSVVVYQTSVAPDGTISKTNHTLTEGQDYLLNITTNNETGQQEATVTFLNEIHTAYIIAYRSLVTSGLITDTLTNAISVNGYNEKTITDTTSSSVKVTTTNGSAEGSSASLTLVKTDQTTGAFLQGAKLELWTTNSDGSKQKQIRSGVTDENGELRIGNLRADTNYLLFETEAPVGHTVSAELLKGKIINIPKNENMNTFAPQLVTNERSKVTFIKQDAESSKLLANAKFIVKNESGLYYNGTDTYGVALWVAEERQIDASVSVSLTSDNTGKITIEGLEPGQYQLEEVQAPLGYTIAVTTTAFTVTKESNGVVKLANTNNIITNNRIKTSISGKKVWDDSNNKFKTRPDSITIHLLQNGQEIAEQELKNTEDQNWTYSFKDLPMYDDKGDAYAYTVSEDKVEGYTTVIEGTTITNTYRNTETTEVSGKKVWDDYNNKFDTRPESITINLLQNGQEIAEQELKNTEDQSWSYSFKDLPVYDDKGDAYAYTVSEDKVDGYTTEIEGTTITNTYRNTETTEVSGKKVWDDYNNKLNSRPESITIHLLQNGKEIAEQELKNTEDQNWTYSFKDLPMYDDKGDAYAYTVSEDKVEGYTTVIDGTTITNTYRNTETTEVSGKKVWDDYNNKFDTRPESIMINLLQNGQEVAEQELKNKEDQNWTYSFKDLPVYDDKGDAYTYTVSEDKVDGYTTAIEGTTITNTYRNTETTDVSGKKVWDDYNNKFKTRPDSITIHLLQNGQEVAEQELKNTEDQSWTYSFKDLPVYDDKGNAYAYTVSEDKVEGYTTEIDGTTITNTYRNTETTEVSGKKVWDDYNNKFDTRPESITINLLQNGQEIAEQELKNTEDQSWSYSFKDLPVYDDKGDAYAYTVSEDKVDGYTTEIEGTTITNTYRNTETTEVSGKKVWDDYNNKLNSRPESITINLLQNGKEIAEQELKNTDDQSWSYSFKDLPVYDDKGDAYTYTVSEDKVEAYTTEIEGTTITNTYRNTETTDVSGKKVWDDYNNKFDTRPESITINLLQNGQEIAEQELKNTDDQNWTYSFKDLPVYDDKGDAYAYTVSEDKVDGYTTEIEGTTITNTYRNTETTEVSGKKVWDDYNNKFDSRPESITINLLQNGQEVAEQELKNTEDQSWTYSFKDLPVYDDKGNAYAYTVSEDKVEGYTTEIDGTTITNTYRNTETTEVSGKKVWDDYNNKFDTRPESITINLLQNGQEIAEQELKNTEDQSWSYSFKDLPVYDDKGDAYAYTVSEDKVEGYTTVIEGTTITNTYRNTETTDISGKKVWDDYNNKFDTRPESITINLLQNGQEIAEQELKNTEDQSWSYSFKDLPVYDDKGDAYTYTVSEDKVDGYRTQIDGFTIKNLLITETPETPSKPETPSTNQHNKSDGKTLPKTSDSYQEGWTAIGSIMIIIAVVSIRNRKKKQV